MPQFSATSKARLETCDVRLQKILNEVIKSIDMIILEGHRGEQDQEAAFRRGNTKLHWPHGKHNSKPSRAVDIAPYLPEVKVDWEDLPAFARLMGYVQRVAEEQGVRIRFGLDWNQDFRTHDESFVDAPHLELVDP